MAHIRSLKVLVAGVFATLCVVLVQGSDIAGAAEAGQSKTIGGLTVYIGVVPAEIVKGPSSQPVEQPMHGRVPKGAHEVHVVAGIFDAATGSRVSDAVVTAQFSPIGLTGTRNKLDPMEIAGTTSYGGFFSLPGSDLYSVKLAIQRASADRPVVVEFKYDHRRQ